MSGTSLDGMDIALCRFEKKKSKWNYKILKAECIPYSKEWKDKLENASLLSGYELSLLCREYGEYIGNACKQFIKNNKVKADYISSHGHTLFHEPAKKL